MKRSIEQEQEPSKRARTDADFDSDDSCSTISEPLVQPPSEEFEGVISDAVESALPMLHLPAEIYIHHVMTHLCLTDLISLGRTCR